MSHWKSVKKLYKKIFPEKIALGRYSNYGDTDTAQDYFQSQAINALDNLYNNRWLETLEFLGNMELANIEIMHLIQQTISDFDRKN